MEYKRLAGPILILAFIRPMMVNIEVAPGFVDFPDADSLGFSHRFGFGILSVEETRL